MMVGDGMSNDRSIVMVDMIMDSADPTVDTAEQVASGGRGSMPLATPWKFLH